MPNFYDLNNFIAITFLWKELIKQIIFVVQVTELPLVHNHKNIEYQEDLKQTNGNALVPNSYSEYKVAFDFSKSVRSFLFT